MVLTRIVTVTVLASVSLFAAADMSGTWKLNVKRSEWGDKPAPDHVFLTIEHRDPSLKYSGAVQRPGEAARSLFKFEGAIDGKEYPLKDDEGNRHIRFTRKSDNTIESVMKSPNGNTEETAETTVLRDGKTMVRKIRAKMQGGRYSRWTEVYEKQ